MPANTNKYVIKNVYINSSKFNWNLIPALKSTKIKLIISQVKYVSLSQMDFNNYNKKNYLNNSLEVSGPDIDYDVYNRNNIDCNGSLG